MSTTGYSYNVVGEVTLGGLDWANSNIKMALLANTYSLDEYGHTEFSDVSAHEIVGGGYPAGGVALTGKNISGRDAKASPAVFSSLDTATSGKFRFAVLYADETIGSLTKPLLIYYDLGSDISVNGSWSFAWDSDKIYRINGSGA